MTSEPLFFEMYKSIIKLKGKFQTKTTVSERRFILCHVSLGIRLDNEKGHMTKGELLTAVT